MLSCSGTFLIFSSNAGGAMFSPPEEASSFISRALLLGLALAESMRNLDLTNISVAWDIQKCFIIASRSASSSSTLGLGIGNGVDTSAYARARSKKLSFCDMLWLRRNPPHGPKCPSTWLLLHSKALIAGAFQLPLPLLALSVLRCRWAEGEREGSPAIREGPGEASRAGPLPLSGRAGARAPRSSELMLLVGKVAAGSRNCGQGSIAVLRTRWGARVALGGGAPRCMAYQASVAG
mmetsp:Transcript_20813/g.37933  ORF Transcript_20813/g.37933 Transcript_20813/m.37933 type:complete len:236 (+) Transcript_20813:377-1084(+)